MEGIVSQDHQIRLANPQRRSNENAGCVNDLIVTPVSFKALNLLLEGYDPVLSSYLVKGFQFGFSLGYQGPRSPRFSKNLVSTKENPEVVRKKLGKEVSLGRIKGPFADPPFKNLQISPIGVVPKKDPGQFRLIQHLSYPDSHSINDHIPDFLKTVSYATVDDAITLILKLGRNCFFN